MKVKISEENREKVEKLLADVNGKAKKHTFRGYSQIEQLAERAEKSLIDYGVPQTRRAGAEVYALSGAPDHFPRSYNGQPIMNGVRIRRGRDAWFIVHLDVGPRYVGPGNESDFPGVLIGEEQAESAERARRQNCKIKVRQPEGA
ncbi:hypothetical protein CKO28_17455 [Rhodovibrio sodomensis]|uniref:Uncharacterized protein n=1 Tax=Rhodovibrio sodomensis TaxID=1088 RepID=A0ABS1DH77_9PROT|nr:hypothetical protein [Rhodovibrio sodomensis]MBK1669825.1 hypothetical protein [Rhodovibrio sodomensis]